MAIKWSAFSAGSAIQDADNAVGLQSSANVKWAWSAVKTYIYGAATAVLAITAAKTVTHTATTTFAGTDGKTLTISNSGTLGGGDAFVLAIAAGKTLTASNSLTLAGTDSTVMTFPSTSATIARTDAGNTFTGNQAVTGSVTAKSALAIPAAGAGSAALLVSSTANFGIFFGSGSPNTALSAAKGSLYLRSDGGGVADRAYINTDGATAWTAVATAG